MERASGILMHITSLPGDYGIGTCGAEAYRFVDFLSAAGQKYWQVLPLGPTGFGDSPYQSFSAFAGNPNLIDLDALIDEGLVERDFVCSFDWGDDPARVDFDCVAAGRRRVLEAAYQRFCEEPERVEKLSAFAEKNAGWLEDYALYMAARAHFDGRPWTEWPDGLRLRQESAMDEYRRILADGIGRCLFTQYEFFTQWEKLKSYANEHGVSIIGDLPIYVPLDSADVWSTPGAFQLDADKKPVAVAGVPPDYFTADGQLWGNPLYDWDSMQRDGYGWWIRRMGAALSLFDVVRFDHFRGLASYWRVPAGEKTAKVGTWEKGPGMHLINALKGWFPGMRLIAEDLGFLTPDVRELLAASGFPGMKVLQFAFDAREPSDYLPHTYPKECVCYTGTHDNTTAAAWFSEAAPGDVALAIRYLGLNQEEGFHLGLIRGGMSSVANLFIAGMQDYLGLPGSARMNTPGTLGGNNWKWRMLPGQLTARLSARIAAMVRIFGR